jgi:putative hemolysin
MKKLTINRKVSAVALLALCALGVMFYIKNTGDQKIVQSEVINQAVFSCAENKSIQGIFFKDKVELSLSDGRTMLLMQAVSGSGARYTNSDESFVFWNKGNTAFVEEGNAMTFKGCVDTKSAPEPAPVVSMANPASTNCTEKGGNLVMEKRGDGGEYGLCYFDDNRACEEWAMLRGDCPVGGRRTTGYDSIDQKYCTWIGGSTLATANSVCTFKDGSSCKTLDLYKGTCPSH